MKGRGTRKYTYSYSSKDTGKVEVEKTTFKLFDFFANCEYFEEKFNYDEVLQLPVLGKGTSEPGTPGIPISEITLITPDPLKVFTETAIGLEGMKVDRKLFEKFEETVKSNPFIKETYEKGDIETVEEYVKAEVLNKPEDYITLDKLRKAVKADRRIPLREFIENILEGIPAFKGKDQLLEEEYEKFVSIYKPDSKYALGIKNYLKAYITDSEVREIVETRQYGRFATNPKMSLDEYRALNGWRTIVPEYVKDYVSLNAFM
jgi:type I restriction enzyme R subunit